jgi:hypothetical protein
MPQKSLWLHSLHRSLQIQQSRKLKLMRKLRQRRQLPKMPLPRTQLRTAKAPGMQRKNRTPPAG